MACFHPLYGWRSRVLNDTGTRSVVFNLADGYKEFPVTVPCGRCIGCRLERSRQWAVRCMHEASLSDDNCFLTLTVDDDHLGDGLLDRPRPGHAGAFALFMKRLRGWYPERKIRYFHCGEYGGQTRRPHYHACLFGFDFPDKSYWSVSNGNRLYRSADLEELWPFGNSTIGSVTFDSAAYVARYQLKKFEELEGEELYKAMVATTGEVSDEYITMSRRPGIGMGWLAKFVSEVYPSDSVITRGFEARPPRAYDRHAALLRPVDFVAVSERREAARVEEENTWERLEAREKCAIARVEHYKQLNRGL